MKLSKNVVVVAGLAALVAATYIGFGVANQNNTAEAQETANKEKGGKWKTPAKSANLSSDKAKLGYVFGAQMASEMMRAGLTEEIELEGVFQAFRDITAGKEPQLSAEEMQTVQAAFQQKRQDEFTALAAENKAKGEEFLTKNAKEKDIVLTESGLQYQVVREGKGKSPTKENSVKVHYLGSLIDGTPFDSSYTRGEPATFPVSGVIPGFSEGLQLMKEGAKYRFVIPSDLAYGPQGPATIGPDQVLVFEVELIEVL